MLAAKRVLIFNFEIIKNILSLLNILPNAANSFTKWLLVIFQLCFDKNYYNYQLETIRLLGNR
jgi:hypothetical protein